MNDSESRAQGSKCYEWLEAVDDRNDFGSWGERFRFYEHLQVVDDMNDPRSGA